MGDGHQCVLARALHNGWDVDVGNATIDFARNLVDEEYKEMDEDRVREALNKRFKDVTVYKDSRVVQVSFTPTQAMVKLIAQFDEGLIPKLILEDERNPNMDDDDENYDEYVDEARLTAAAGVSDEVVIPRRRCLEHHNRACWCPPRRAGGCRATTPDDSHLTSKGRCPRRASNSAPRDLPMFS
jgi:hypothetical protein